MTKSQFNTTRANKKDNEKTKTINRWAVKKSIKAVRLEIRWVEEDLWWEGIVEQVYLESGVE